MDEITTLNASIEARFLNPGAGRSLEGQCGKGMDGMGGNWWFLDKQWFDYWQDERFSLVSKDAGCCRQCVAQAPQTAAHLVPYHDARFVR